MRRKKRVLKRWFSRFGESFTVEGSACHGVFALPPNALLRHFYTAGEIDLLGRPLWALYTLPTPYICRVRPRLARTILERAETAGVPSRQRSSLPSLDTRAGPYAVKRTWGGYHIDCDEHQKNRVYYPPHSV